jgi:transposase
MPSSPEKSRQARLSVEQKKELCMAKQHHVKLTQQGLIDLAKKKFGIETFMTAIHRMLRDSKSILSIRVSENNKKKKGTARYSTLDDAVDLWFNQISSSPSYNWN